MKRLFALVFFIGYVFTLSAGEGFVLKRGCMPKIFISENEKTCVFTALELLKKDIRSVFGESIYTTEGDGDILIGTLGVNHDIELLGICLDSLKEVKQGFLLAVTRKGRLLIAGSDAHGTAYGIMELSRLIGVSPWEWWADAAPASKDSVALPYGYYDFQYPNVEYRGIFINDEDWGLMPWSSLTYDTLNGKGVIGAKTNEKIFELMLRLRANYYWPAMHECTKPFFLTNGNREVAKKYGIYIGGSHCEPMASSTAGEWPVRGTGAYDYVNNRTAVLNFWEDRIKEVANQEIIYTLGMRGVHDSGMQGATTIQEQKEVLEKVFEDQRNLIAKYISDDVESVPQVFIPYKEILDVYNSGLSVPDDVTLMWCDDNYGYIRHFPTEEERARKGGNGIYYHVSYWGRPHDYLWLGTFHPALLKQQMELAYDKGIRRMWILNVGDIKPAEYQIELFLDMAWNINNVRMTGTENHLCNFLKREFGESIGNWLMPLMLKYYDLAFVRKPEFMGNTRVEESNRKYYGTVRDLPWSESYVANRLKEYETIANQIDSLSAFIPSQRQDTYFELVKYPVLASQQMNEKHLGAYYARHGKAKWNVSDCAMDSICNLTEQYNTGYGNHGKWNRIMTFKPRNLPVFEKVSSDSEITPTCDSFQYISKFEGKDVVENQGAVIPRLGYSQKAILLNSKQRLAFVQSNINTDSIFVEVRLVPTHPIAGNKLRFTLSFDGQQSGQIDYATKGRSEEWKQNVLRNQAVRRIAFPVKEGANNHSIILEAVDDGVIFDQMYVFDKLNLINNKLCEQ